MVRLSKGSFKALLSLIMIFLPRSAVAYPAYCIAPLLMIDWRKAIRPQARLGFFLIVSLYIANISAEVSLSVALLEYALCFAFFLGVFGAEMRIPGVSVITMTRAFSVIIAVTGLFSLVQQGFPARLPYVDFLPDYYYATFGLGGAKTVTILSYVAIIAEIVHRRLTKKFHIGYLLLAVFNFLMPNFIIGIICGLLSACVMLVRRPIVFILISLVLAVIVGPYFLFRFDTVSESFTVVYGSHPKLLQFFNTYEFYSDNSHLMFTGSGIGQYGGQATFWASPMGQILSSFRLPDLPGMFPPETHLTYLNPILETFIDNTWAINSTANKPYSSISVIIVEFGLPLTGLIVARLFWSFVQKTARLEFVACFIFIMTLMLADRVHDIPWFGMSLIVVNGLIAMVRDQDQDIRNTDRSIKPVPLLSHVPPLADARRTQPKAPKVL